MDLIDFLHEWMWTDHKPIYMSFLGNIETKRITINPN